MTEELTPSEKLERLERLTEQTRAVVRCIRRATGFPEEPLRLKVGKMIERRLQDGGLAQRNPAGVYIDEKFTRPLQSIVEARHQRLKQKKEYEESPAEEKPKKEPKEEKFDFSVRIY